MTRSRASLDADYSYRKLVEQVYKRDGYRCQICQKQLKKSRKGRDCPDSPTIDHIKPSSKGGRDSLENMQVACLECNNKKGSHYLW